MYFSSQKSDFRYVSLTMIFSKKNSMIFFIDFVLTNEKNLQVLQLNFEYKIINLGYIAS